MGNATVLLGALLLGAGGGFAAAMLAAPAPVPAPAPAGGSAGPDRATAERLDRLERRIEEIATAAGAPAPAPVPIPAPAPVPVPGAAAVAVPPPDRLDALEQRIATLEKGGLRGTPIPTDLSKVPVAQALAMLRNLDAEKRFTDAAKAAEELLRRDDLTPQQRLDLEMQSGFSLRGQGKHAEAEARFKESLARVGDATENAPALGFQIAWERHFQQDHAGAAAEMERVANHPSAGAITRMSALYNVGHFGRLAGDREKARAALERLLTQHAADIPPALSNMKAQAEAWLKELQGN